MSNNLIDPIATAPTRRGTTNSQPRKLRASSEAMYIAKLKKLHREVIGQTRKTLKTVIRMGGILRRWKDQCRHGNWEKLVEDKLPFDIRTARNYMGCYDNREALLKTENVSDFGISEAYRLLPSLSKKSEATHDTSAAHEENTAVHVLTKKEVISRLRRALLQGLEELNLGELTAFEIDLLAFKEKWLAGPSVDSNPQASLQLHE